MTDRKRDPPFELPKDRLSRRRFLALLGASAAVAAGCSRPDRGEIIARPDPSNGGVAPGREAWYASAFEEGELGGGVLVKTREGRPIHVEGNDKLRPRAAAPLRAIADVLRLYDPERLRRPDGGWDAALKPLLSSFKDAAAARRPVLLATGAVISPARLALIRELKRVLPGLEHLRWEPSSPGGAATLMPRLRLDRADVIAAFEADFLDGRRPEAAAAFAARRKPEAAAGLNRLYAFESAMSVTGTNADHRIRLLPSGAAFAAFALARALRKSGRALPAGVSPTTLAPFTPGELRKRFGVDQKLFAALVRDLDKAGTRAAVIAGDVSPEAHAACRLVNVMLGADRRTIEPRVFPKDGAPAPISETFKAFRDMARGKYAAALFWGANPGYAFPDKALRNEAMAGTPIKAFIGLHKDETASACRVVLPEHHWLESWGDVEPEPGLLCLRQPAISPLYNTRQGEDILLDLVRGLGGRAPGGFRDFLMARWRREVFPGALTSFERFWRAALHDGFHGRPRPGAAPALSARAVKKAAGAALGKLPGSGSFELVLRPGATVHDGRYANSGWLQELPHPVSKKTWGNTASISPADAERLSIRDGDVVRLKTRHGIALLPALVQPGQAPGTISAELGYGRRSGAVASKVGENLYPLVGDAGNVARASLERTSRRFALALTQKHHRMEGRDIIRTRTIDELKHAHEKHHPEWSLNAPRVFKGRKWGMVIDLSACVGCGACVVACQSENNVPSVGPEEIRRGREMHWMRVDRYYEGDPSDPTAAHQPMLCQHCDDAPCETVCPVYATNHSPDGLNQMVYNRCVGTRYCANNCPYKVRRFNFFDFTSGKKAPETLIHNPEVSLRPRGVMEKCTFCVQRIQEAKLKGGRALRDLRPACAAACPAGAITFGDLNDPNSDVARFSQIRRGYKVLAELGAKPSVTYLARVKHPALGSKPHG